MGIKSIKDIKSIKVHMFISILFFLELFILFLLSGQLTRFLSSFIYRVTKNKKITVVILAFLFFPGTLIHELSHYLAAKLLFVRTYGLHLLPKLDGENLKLGSVSIEKPDFFRHLLIGMAPFFTGTSIVLGTLYLAAHNHLLNEPLYISILGYILFEVGNTMFSSKKDMEGAIELLIFLIIVIGISYILGVQLPWLNPDLVFSNPLVKQALEKGTIFLLAPIAIDVILIALLKLFHSSKS